MNRQSMAHLNYDQLLQALVDTADLGDAARDHLEACPACRRQVKRLTQRYDRMGQMAKQLAPEPAHAFRIPAQQSAAKRWLLKPALAMGMVAALIMVFTIWWPQHIDISRGPEMRATLDRDMDDQLMAEIDDLVVDALPETYQELASLSDSQTSENLDELIDWIAPPLEEDELEPRV